MFQFPTPKGGGELEMSRWFQSLVGVLMVDVEYQEKGPQFGKCWGRIHEHYLVKVTLDLSKGRFLTLLNSV